MKLTTIIKNFFHKDLLSNFFKANVVETESQSNFSQFIKNKDFQSIIAFIKNGYTPTTSQQDYFSKNILNFVHKYIKPDIFGERFYEGNSGYEISPEILTSFIVSHQKKLMAPVILSNFFSPKNINLLENIFLLNLSKNQKDYSTCLNKENIISLVVKDEIRILEKEKSDLNQDNINTLNVEFLLLNDSDKENTIEKSPYFFTSIDDLKKEIDEDIFNLLNKNSEDYTMKNILLSNNNSLFFPNLEKNFNNVYFSIISNKSEISPEDDFYKKIQSLSINIDTLSDRINTVNLFNFFSDIIIKELIQKNNAQSIAKIALDNKCPTLFAFIVNTAQKIHKIENVEISFQELENFEKITLSKLKKANSFKFTSINSHYFSPFYQNILTISSIYKKDLSSQQHLTKEQSLNDMISKMKNEEYQNKTKTINTDELIQSSNLDLELKEQFSKTLSLSKELYKNSNINIEEKKFCSTVETNLLYLLELQASFLSSEQANYINSSKEQCLFIFNQLEKIREITHQRSIDNIAIQIQELEQHQRNTKIITKI